MLQSATNLCSTYSSMAVCPSRNFSPHATFKAASQLRKNVKSEVEQMNLENEPGDFQENSKIVFDPLFHYLGSFAQSHFSHFSTIGTPP